MYPPSDIKLPKQFMPEHPFDPGILNIRDEKLSAYPRSPDEMKQELSDYYAATTNLDFEFGRVLAALETRGIAKNTIVLVSSDQGLACGGYHALMGKQNLYEDVKPPLFIAGPGIPHGHSDALVYLYDLFPTICDLAGAKTPDVVEGKSLMPVVLGKQPRVRDYLFGAYSDIQRMVRDERWKLYEFHVDGQRHTLLFDLKNDPEELKNLADDPSHAEIRVKLEQQLAAERAAFGDPVVFKD
jgi:arylsulfatase A-like enzyme